MYFEIYSQYQTNIFSVHARKGKRGKKNKLRIDDCRVCETKLLKLPQEPCLVSITAQDILICVQNL